MLKRVLAVILAAVLVVFMLVGCGSKESARMLYGDKDAKNALLICVDSYYNESDLNINQEYENRLYFNSLAEEIKSACGIEAVIFELLPQKDAERETALQRLRTEIMAGEGPDLFIMQTSFGLLDGLKYLPALFNYPEKNMEAGIFLPLDEYMENNTQFTDWDKQTKVILDAGRNEEGQQIIPLTYTFRVLIYPKNEVDIPYTQNLTRREILDDSKYGKLSAALYTAIGKEEFDADGYGSRGLYFDAVNDALGQYADFENEELLFTEDELYEITREAIELQTEMDENEWSYEWMDTMYFPLIYELFNNIYEEEMALVPRYSTDGGVTATITAYMAVNRNSNHPEEAFSVIDYLMQEEKQRYSELYASYFGSGIPLQNDLGSEEKTLQAFQTQRFLREPYMTEYLSIKEQITAVNFKSDFDILLNDMIYDCSNEFRDTGEISRETVSETYEKMKRMVGE